MENKIISAGLIMWDVEDGIPKILLCHMGGPLWENKDLKGWGIPKGRVEDDDTILETAIREFEEETGITPVPPFESIGYVTYKNGKVVHAYAFRSKFPGEIKSNLFFLEWPKGSGEIHNYPENDKGGMFALDEAMEKIIVSQEDFINKMESFFKSKNLI